MFSEEVFRAPGFLACEQRAFVLHAVGIPAEIVDLPDAFVLYVAPESAAAARDHIHRFDQETSRPEPAKPAPILFAGAWAAPLLFALTIIVVAYLAGERAWRFDWRDVGALRAGIQHSSEWWRAATALTLHVDHAHLLGNLGFGAFFGYLAARLLGSGIALATTLSAAIIGNLLDSVFMPNSHVSMGASTWVFATLGVVSSYAWRLQVSARLKWAQRSAPLVAGIMLLALIGSGGEDTDVLAHLTGFASGVLIGAVHAHWRDRVSSNAIVQWTAGIVAVATIAGAWIWAAANT